MELSVALKEWAVVCDALASGRQMMLLRKGGISEAAGQFELEHRQFLLFPTYVHQNPAMLKPADRNGLTVLATEPGDVRLALYGEATDIVRISQRDHLDRLEDQHIWTAPLLDMRFNYRPANPLYVLLVRAWVLPVPVTIVNTIEYAGCKSWVPLERAIDVSGSRPAIEDAIYAARRADILQRLNVPA